MAQNEGTSGKSWLFVSIFQTKSTWFNENSFIQVLKDYFICSSYRSNVSHVLYKAQLQTFNYFLQYGPKYWLIGYCFWLFPSSYLRRSHNKKNQRDIRNAFSSSRECLIFGPILDKLKLSRQILREVLNIKVHENQPSGSPVILYGQIPGWTDMTKLRVAFRSFVKAHKRQTMFLTYVSCICKATVCGTHTVRQRCAEHIL